MDTSSTDVLRQQFKVAFKRTFLQVLFQIPFFIAYFVIFAITIRIFGFEWAFVSIAAFIITRLNTLQEAQETNDH